jgi:hypothetical protein
VALSAGISHQALAALSERVRRLQFVDTGTLEKEVR